jgi:hypothetical protein
MTASARVFGCFAAVLLLGACASTGRRRPAEAPPAPPSFPAAAESRSAAGEFLERYDADRDGRVRRDEYPRGDAGFRNLDRDRDGSVTARDFAAPVQMPADLAAPFLIVRRFAGPDADAIAIGDLDEAFEDADLDHDGKLTSAEFLGPTPPKGPDRFAPLLAAADQGGDGALALDELKAYALRRDRDGDGRLSRRERMRPGAEPPAGWFEPSARERAPDFTLAREEGGGSVTLSAFAGRKPVALVFGSFT